MWPNLQKTADLVAFTEEILDEKLHEFVVGFYTRSSDFVFSMETIYLGWWSEFARNEQHGGYRVT